MKRSLLLWSPAAVVAGIIFFASSLPGQSFPAVAIWSFDKVVHAAVYAVLGLLVALPLDRLKLIQRRTAIVIVAAMVVTAYGISDELHQRFTPGRSPDVFDVIADAIGGVLGAWAWVALRARRRAPSS